MLKLRSVPGPLICDPVGLLEQGGQRIHGLAHPRVVQGADLEVEVGEILGGALGRLGHGRVGVAQHAPLLLQADRDVDLAPVGLVVPLHAVGVDVGQVEGIGAAAHADVGVHRLHDGLVELAPGGELLLAGVLDEAAAEGLVVVVPEGHAAVLGGHAHQFLAQFHGLEALDLDVDLLAGLQLDAVGDELFGQLVYCADPSVPPRWCSGIVEP